MDELFTPPSSSQPSSRATLLPWYIPVVTALANFAPLRATGVE